MTVYEMNFPQSLEMLMELIKTKQEGLVVEKAKNLWLATGRTDGTYSETVQQEFNIPVFHSEHIGGTCVVFPDDLSFCELSLSYSDFGERAIKAIKDYLTTFGLVVRLAGNDLMLYSAEEKEEYKVASYGSGWLAKGYMQTVVHVSIGMNEELVSRLCTKPCQKKPRGLAQYGVTAQAVYEVIKPIIEARA